MTIDRLPTEILTKIFSYLTTYENVALVNSRFYSVMCCMHQPIIYLELDDSAIDSKLQSIMLTPRKITKIEINFGTQGQEKRMPQFKLVIGLIEKFSTSIVYLKLEGCLEVPDLLEILSLVTKVVHLVLYSVRCAQSEPSTMKLHLMPWNDLNLHHLKILKCYSCSHDIMVIFNRLPAAILETLTLRTQHMNELSDLFRMQTKIKKLTLIWPSNGHFSNADLLDGLRLESLVWTDLIFDKSFATKILYKQTNLESLNLIFGSACEDVINVITTRLTELRRLSVNLGEYPFDAVTIKKLTMLTDLRLQSEDFGGVAHFETLAAIDNSTITTLDIEYYDRMSNNLIADLARSVPNLKVLRFSSRLIIDMFPAIMKNFNFVEAVQFGTMNFNVFKGDVRRLSEGSCANERLKELKIYNQFAYSTALLQKLMKHYPNLKNLLIGSDTDFSEKTFKMILNGFEKLESLTLTNGTCKLTVADLYVLREHRNLKFIAMHKLNIEFTSEIKKNLMKILDIVSLSQEGSLKMAVSRKTMEKESILMY